MAIEHKSTKLKDLYEKIDNKEIVLPNFQRGFVWKVEEQKKLISSTVVQIPIGSTLHLRGRKDSFSSRALCERESVQPSVSECQYVLDGQQRLSTLKNAFYDIYANYNWRDKWDNLFSDLRVRWFFYLNEEDDFFGYKKLYFDAEKILETEPRELLDSIVFKKILKTKDLDKWYHPGYIPKDEEGNRIYGDNEKRVTISKYAMNDKMVPLYEVYLGSDGIHNKIIEKIALEQAEILKAKIQDIKVEEPEKYEQFLIDLLTSVESTIAEFVNEMTKEEIEKLIDELAKKWIQKFCTFMERLIEIEMPIISLEEKEAGRAAAIFEEINKGGTALSIYDLIVAKAANADTTQSSLTDRIISLLEENYTNSILYNHTWKPTFMTDIKDNMLTPKFQSMYLNSLSILIAKNKGDTIDKSIISRNYVLNLSAEEINANNEKIVNALVRTYFFLQLRLGLTSEKGIIYDYMILPLVYFFESNDIWENANKLNVLEAWYWSWLFSGKYKDRQDDQFVKDIEYLSKILVDNDEIDHSDFISQRIFNTPDYSDRDTILHLNENLDCIAPKAMKDGILQYVLSKKPNDFLPNNVSILSAVKSVSDDTKATNTNLRLYKLEAHHIIPLGVITNIGESTDSVRKDKSHILNSPLNFTYISEYSNHIISDMEYTRYKAELGAKVATHYLTLDEYDNKESIQESLENRFTMIKTGINAEISELIS